MFLLMKKQGIRDMRHGKKEARDKKMYYATTSWWTEVGKCICSLTVSVSQR